MPRTCLCMDEIIHVVTVAETAVRRDNLAWSADFAYGDVIDGFRAVAEISLGRNIPVHGRVNPTRGQRLSLKGELKQADQPQADMQPPAAQLTPDSPQSRRAQQAQRQCQEPPEPPEHINGA